MVLGKPAREGESPVFETLRAVSYTHLDVYKRQQVQTLFADGADVKAFIEEHKAAIDGK